MGGLCEAGGRELVSGRPTTSPARRAQLRPLPPLPAPLRVQLQPWLEPPTLALLLLGQLLATTVTLTEAQVSMGPGAYGARL